MTAADDGRQAIRPLLGPGPFRRLLTGQAISSLGSWVGTVAFIAAAYDLTGSPTAVGGVLVIRLLPPVLAAPLGGVLADRFERRRMMVLANVGMGVLIAFAPFANLPLLYAIAFASESLALMFLPARDATIPDLVPRGSLPTANGLIMGSSYGAIPVSAALFSGLRLLSGNLPGWVPLSGFFADYPLAIPFFFDATTFFVAAALIAGLPRATKEMDGSLNVFEGLGDAFRFARRTAAVRGLATGVAVAMFGGGVLFALGIAYVRDTLGGGDVEFGFLVALWGLGMATGIGLVHLLVRRGEAYVFQASVAVCGGILVGMAFMPFIWLALLAALVFGIAFAVAILLALTLVQRIADEEMRGRLVAGAHMLFRVSLALGAIGVGGAVAGLRPVALDLGPLHLELDENQIGLVIGGGLILLGAAASRGVLRAPAEE